MGGSCTQVSRPGKQETGASEDALRTATIECRMESRLDDALHNLFHHELLNPITDEQ